MLWGDIVLGVKLRMRTDARERAAAALGGDAASLLVDELRLEGSTSASGSDEEASDDALSEEDVEALEDEYTTADEDATTTEASTTTTPKLRALTLTEAIEARRYEPVVTCDFYYAQTPHIIAIHCRYS